MYQVSSKKECSALRVAIPAFGKCSAVFIGCLLTVTNQAILSVLCHNRNPIELIYGMNWLNVFRCVRKIAKSGY